MPRKDVNQVWKSCCQTEGAMKESLIHVRYGLAATLNADGIPQPDHVAVEHGTQAINPKHRP